MTTSARVTSVAKHYAALIVELPEPPETFMARDVPGLTRDDVMALSSREILIRETGYANDLNEWSVRPIAYDAARKFLRDSEVFDCCGSTGFTNGGDGFYCSDCGQSLTREEVERVFGSRA